MWVAFSSSFSRHRLEVHIKSVFHMLQPTAKTHTHTHTHTLRHNLILLYCPQPHLLSQGRRRKAFMQNRPSALIWRCTDKRIHTHCMFISTHTHIQARARTYTRSVSPVVSQMKRCQLLQQFYRGFHRYHRMQISNLFEIKCLPIKK